MKVTTKKTEADPFDLRATRTLKCDLVIDKDKKGLLQKNKKELWNMLNMCKFELTDEEKFLLIAIAMQETRHMETSERDKTKDGTDSANLTKFNLNIYMLRQLGYRQGKEKRGCSEQRKSGTQDGDRVRCQSHPNVRSARFSQLPPRRLDRFRRVARKKTQSRHLRLSNVQECDQHYDATIAQRPEASEQK